MSQLDERISELEGRIDSLHKNRHVLLGIIEAMERETKARLMDLEIKNDRLRRDNCRYARAVMGRNIRILELEDKLCLQTGRTVR